LLQWSFFVTIMEKVCTEQKIIIKKKWWSRNIKNKKINLQFMKNEREKKSTPTTNHTPIIYMCCTRRKRIRRHIQWYNERACSTIKKNFRKR
jgi:hypothetical protein